MQWTVESPEATVILDLALDDGRLAYRVARRGVPLVDWSRLGLEGDDDLAEGLELLEPPVAQRREEEYELAHGRTRRVTAVATAATILLRGRSGATLALDVRVGDDAIAIRHRLPADGAATSPAEVRECTSVALARPGRAWIQSTLPVAAPAHENTYHDGVPIGTPSDTATWDLPAVFEIEGQWLLLAESDLHVGAAGSRLGGTPAGREYRFVGPDPSEGRGVADTRQHVARPFALPWRVIAFADRAHELLETTAMWHVAEPSRIDDPSWIRPGRAAWSWWSENASSTDPAAQRRFIDFAALMSWEYSLVDANWNRMGDEAIVDLVAYGAERGVGVMLWYNSGGPHNAVTEEPRDRMLDPEIRRAELARIAQWGVAGIKVDFFESDKPTHIAQYLGILEDAAEVGLLVNFHGCAVPRGWERTWPNLMTMEAVRGAEWYLIDDGFAAVAAKHNTILPFTRNAIGPMDYTPVTFSDRRGPRRTTAAHELALTVVFQSSLLHLADAPESYLAQHPAVIDLLRAVPASWDETVGLAGEPGDHVVVARRLGDEWWVAGITGDRERAAVELDVRRLAIAGGSWIVVGDGGARDEVAVSRPAASAVLAIPAIAAAGGFLARWRPA